MDAKFIADVHLGKLARSLRMLGFDTLYQNNFSTEELETMALEQDRLLLSRNPAFAKNSKLRSLIIRSEEPVEQLKLVVNEFQLADDLHPFSRCLVCNGKLHTVPKQNVINVLQKNTIIYFDEFWQCEHCKRVYWKGPHYDRMCRLLKTIAPAH